MIPDPSKLNSLINNNFPVIGFYDAPSTEAFGPLIKAEDCLFSYYNNWNKGETVRITKEQAGCRGAAYWLCDVPGMDHEKFVKFLYEFEGLKESSEKMSKWLKKKSPYKMKYENILVGPLKDDMYEYLVTASFFVNNDSLSALITAANYFNDDDELHPVLTPFGSGCMQMVQSFKDLAADQGAISSTDIAMRHHLPPDIMSITFTKSLYEKICTLDEKSFLFKPFWFRLVKSRTT